ncbi:MAG TPA: DUF1206 domain-containing protein [Acidimicrobiales bacterium]|nr:DUF1206 domain-containing protein [Acidimicrobiales bacterium]
MTNAHGTTTQTRNAANGDWKETMGRIGLVGRGVMYAVIGLLAIQLALGNDSQEASNSGAIEWIAQQPLGKFLLIALTISLLCLAAWRLLDAAVGDPVEGDEPSDRAEYAIKGVVYAALAVGALSATISNWNGDSGSGGGSGDSQNQEAAATVLEWPAGQWIVTAVGLGIIGYAIYMFKKHVMDEEFLQRLSTSKDWVEKLGRGGYAARSAIFLVIGWFLTQAGLTHEAGETKGLSGALQEISGRSWGQLLLLAVAVGLLAFGLFSLAEAKYRRDA